jgi:hypothetical protein
MVKGPDHAAKEESLMRTISPQVGRPDSKQADAEIRFRRQEKSSPCIGSNRSQAWTGSVQKPAARDTSLGMAPLLVPEKVAAEMLGVSPRTVWQLGKEGKVLFGRIGRRKNYLVSSLTAYAERIAEGG